MCYPKPGPRCSAHARARMVQAQDALVEARSAHQRLVEQSSAYVEAGHAARVEDAARCRRLKETEWEQAQKEWWTTPEGLAGLEDEMQRVLRSASPDLGRVAVLEFRKREASSVRAQQLADYQASKHPVACLSNRELRAEMEDLVGSRLPLIVDDKPLFDAEMARYDAVVAEVGNRKSAGVWNRGRDLAPAPQVQRLLGRLGDVPSTVDPTQVIVKGRDGLPRFAVLRPTHAHEIGVGAMFARGGRTFEVLDTAGVRALEKGEDAVALTVVDVDTRETVTFESPRTATFSRVVTGIETVTDRLRSA